VTELVICPCACSLTQRQTARSLDSRSCEVNTTSLEESVGIVCAFSSKLIAIQSSLRRCQLFTGSDWPPVVLHVKMSSAHHCPALEPPRLLVGSGLHYFQYVHPIVVYLMHVVLLHPWRSS
jgi:hypothetical protein